MATAYKQLTLDSATLSGGAVLAAAGSGLPRRITGEANVTVRTQIRSQGAEYGSWIVDPTGLYIWCNWCDLHVLKKIRISDGTIMQTVDFGAGHFTTPVSRADSTYFYLRTSVGGLTRVAFSDGSYVLQGGTPIVTPLIVQWGGTADTVWALIGTTPTEYTFSTGVATGRTCSTGVYDMFCYSSGGVWYMLVSSGALALYQYRLSDLALIASWTFTSSSSTWPGSSYPANAFLIGMHIDPLGNLQTYEYSSGLVYRLTPGGGTGTGAVSAVVLRETPELGGTIRQTNWSLYHPRAFACAYTDDGNYMLVPSMTSATASSLDYVVKKNIGIQRMRWAPILSTTLATTAYFVGMPGSHGRSFGATYDHRRIRFYYSTNGGVTRYEFVPGEKLSSGVAVPANTALTIDADICLVNCWAEELPFVSEYGGYGPVVVYDDGGRVFTGFNKGMD